MEIREVNVQPGDTLFSLAERHTGNGNRWRDIFILNAAEFIQRGEKSAQVGPDMIWPGMTLKIIDYRPGEIPPLPSGL